MNAATLSAAHWWSVARPDAAGWIENYQKSLTTRHRVAISRIVGELGAKSLLEIGCHCAPNLMRLTEDHPGLVCAGCDVNEQAIAAGKKWAHARGVSHRVDLAQGQFPTDTMRLPSQQYDVVLSCYSLAYVSPADIDAALYEVGRLATQAVILAEPMMPAGQVSKATMMSSGYSEWRHDYVGALPWIGTLRGWTTGIVPVSPPIDRLNAILVVRNDGARGANTQ